MKKHFKKFLWGGFAVVLLGFGTAVFAQDNQPIENSGDSTTESSSNSTSSDKSDNKTSSSTDSISNNGSVAQPAAGNTSTQNAKTEIEEIEIDTPASVTGEKYQGTGTVTDFTTTGAKAFYTIRDSEGKVFYLIVDMEKTEDNVYFLTEINQENLQESSGQVAQSQVTPAVSETQPSAETQVTKEKESSFDKFPLYVLGLVAAASGVLWFKAKKKKSKNEKFKADDSDDNMDDTYDDSDIWSTEEVSHTGSDDPADEVDPDSATDPEE